MTILTKPNSQENRNDEHINRLRNEFSLLSVKYAKTGDAGDLDDTVAAGRALLDVVPMDHLGRVDTLYRLGLCLKDRYDEGDCPDDLEEAAILIREVVDSTHETHPDRIERLENLESLLSDVFAEKGGKVSIDHLNDAIRFGQEIVDSTQPDDPKRPARLSHLGGYFVDRYVKTTSRDDYEKATQLYWDALNATPSTDPNRVDRLDELDGVLRGKYIKSGSLKDLENLIQVERELINLVSPNYYARGSYLASLGNHLHDRYQKLELLDNLNEAIEYTRQAMQLSSKEKVTWKIYTKQLAICLGSIYSRLGDAKDFQEAVHYFKETIELTSEKDPQYPSHFNDLGLTHQMRFSKHGDLSDNQEAIKLVRKAISISSNRHIDRAEYLSKLGTYLGTRYSRKGELADLDEAIRVGKEAVEKTPMGDPDRSQRLENLATNLGQKYENTGEVAAIEEAIMISREALDTSIDDDTGRSKRMYSLGINLLEMYSMTKAKGDLEEAIQLQQKALEATPKEHPRWQQQSASLAAALTLRKDQTQIRSSLDRSINMERELIKGLAKNNPDRARILRNLGGHLATRYLHFGRTENLEEGLAVTQEALELTPEDHPDRRHQLRHLSVLLRKKTEIGGSLENLEKAIQLGEKALNATPSNHPDRGTELSNMGELLYSKSLKTKESQDLIQSISYHQAALNHPQSPTQTRIIAGKKALRNSIPLRNYKQADQISKLSISLLPELLIRSQTSADKQNHLSIISGLASDAAAVAMFADQSPSTVLKYLEQGRGMLASYLEEMRTDIQALQREHPALAERFIRLRNELEPSYPSEMNSDDVPLLKSQKRYEAGKSLDKLIEEIRQCPGFETFPLGLSDTEIRGAARDGPVVVINASSIRCDAILVEKNDIRLLHLPHLKNQDIKSRAWTANIKTPDTLAWLWDVAVSPILDALGFTYQPKDDWPHVWWIPTGFLARFPLHAAGYHGYGSTATTLDRVVSSYSSSIKAIINGRQQSAATAAQKQALLVGIEHTIGHPTLPFAKKEVAILQKWCETMKVEHIQPQRRKQDILPHLSTCNIFHFAGHGYTDEENPLNSHILLEDSHDGISVATLLDINLRQNSPFLAYLSACGTGQTVGSNQPDEITHLISCFQLAGFRHVIGTLWEVNDETCLDMARLTYEGLKEGGMTDASVAHGLHHATRALRDHWINTEYERKSKGPKEKPTPGSEKSEQAESDEKKEVIGIKLRDFRICDAEELLTWVPYVHFGV